MNILVLLPACGLAFMGLEALLVVVFIRLTTPKESK